MGVEKGDVIKVQSENDWVLQKVEWRQSFKSKEDEYYSAKFQNLTRTDEANGEGVIFIQKDKASDFKNLGQKDGDEYQITVNNDFRYGERDKKGNFRFLVYHDTSREIFQHRFVQGMIVKFGAAATDQIKRLGFSDVSSISAAFQGSIGEPLKRYY